MRFIQRHCIVLQKLYGKPTLGCIAQDRWTSSATSDDYQYMHKSKLPMHHFQPSLPRLPIPKLVTTCQRYLNAQKALLNDDQFRRTEAIVQKFQKDEGKSLNEELRAIDKQNKHTSYISEPWFDMYLRSREPVVINYNPYLGIHDDPKPEYNDQLIRSSNIVISSLRFFRSLRSHLLEPEVYHLDPSKSDTESFRKVMKFIPSQFSWYGAFLYKAFPLDMSQYQGLFNSSRIPKQDRDELLSDFNAKHMLVIRNGQFYAFDVLDNNGNIKEPSYIHACLKHILCANKQKPEFPVAVLTTENRNTWAAIRQQLHDAGNANTLRCIDTAIFALVLDDNSTDMNPVTISEMMLHGDGYSRWFDKSFQVIISKDAKVGINFEHSWGDGVAVLRYLNDVFKDSTSKRFVHPHSVPMQLDLENVVHHLEFKLDLQIKNGIKTALQKFETTISKLKFSLMQYQKFGKGFLKLQKCSPDAIMQLAFQIAYYRQTGKTAATYESCSTAAFRHGRTETIRPATVATKRCSEAFMKRDSHTSSELRGLVEDCSKIHGKLVKEAALGQGFDRHLFALKMLAERHNPQQLPEIFSDSAYQSINHNILSTSTLSSEALLIASFGPVVEDGMGLGYLVSDDELDSMITSYPPLCDADGFIDCMTRTLDDLHEVFVKTSPK